MNSIDTREYDVAISYAEEDHDYVDPIKDIFGKRGITFADYSTPHMQAKLWGGNFYDHLIDLYQKKARYCIMFLSKNYAAQLWTDLERQAAQARAFKECREYILPIRLDDTEIPGILPTTFYLKYPPASPQTIADAFTFKLEKRMQDASLINQLKEKHKNNHREIEIVKSKKNTENILIQYVNSIQDAREHGKSNLNL